MDSRQKQTRQALPEDTLLPRDTRRSLPIALLRAREAVMGRFRPMLAAHDVTEQQWRVIRVLGETSPLDATEVADRACVLAPSLTRIIKALEDRALITRERDASDGRRALLAIAPAGVALLREVTPESRAIYADLEARYGAKQIERLLDMLDELANIAP
ncbi:homoprotocatechuate degradation operon regulator, HpaR [Mesorhizobium sp. L-8-10]|uniref:homoprotocatechuate degradation operon regulator HpaR n=1 Tax=unclassified Mesorhizobium TaxID=325217 RepID=UPI0019279181|nr:MULTISPECIES: homoprotocatechuate degradation operon regulator HpaR [unclassified Mesorhizobium]BCH24482.1 homoprotocatechuate degradation operon regulator, HpaR [Mesorhizobium sp. L-8-3]BCH32215.1 homoprotocatechuate degradation operon regulator, HpaR [Mesorhizobium sp. L-8-10]